MEVLLIMLIILVILFCAFFYRKGGPKFVLQEDIVIFPDEKRTIRYSDILGIERDMPGSFVGMVTNVSYVISYVDENGMIDSFRFFKIGSAASQWGIFKSKVVTANPSVKIDESIFKIR